MDKKMTLRVKEEFALLVMNQNDADNPINVLGIIKRDGLSPLVEFETKSLHRASLFTGAFEVPAGGWDKLIKEFFLS